MSLVRPKQQQQQQQQQLGAEPWGASCGAGAVDDSLTNLQWLQGFSFLTASPEKPSSASLLGHPRLLQGSYAPASPPAGDTAAMGVPTGMGKPTSSSSSLQPLAPTPEVVDYRTNGQVKPPYSYATLISMAMRASPEAKLTLSAIYAWITENFCYYRHAEPSWQNSIRHNLSLNKCFQKVARQKDEPGKGGFWRINPQHADRFVDGIFRRRRVPTFQETPLLPASGAELGCFRGRGHGPLQEDQVPRLPGRQRHLGKLPGQGPSKAAWSGARSPLASMGREGVALPGDLSWASVLEDTFVGSGSSIEDLELTAALSSLAAEEVVLASADQPASALSQEGPPPPVTALVEDLTLYAEPLGQPWGEEEAATEPPLGPPWAFEEEGGTCFVEGFLAEMQPWEA
ncbi:forkhead box protein J1-B-like [Zootoca vivipara]|uniref:forkhead box protein J1-B-like n=1 Tax=Zootoca vivipara TaxID=8524 RepID=UPI00293BD0B9|nr:forkhead box protein J1-B-like [Zootoca vivipara]